MAPKLTTVSTATVTPCACDDECCSELVTRNNSIYSLPQDKKCITPTTNEDGGMKVQNLCNFNGRVVFNSSEEDCDITTAPLNFRVDWSTSDTERMNDWLLTTPVLQANPKARRDELTVKDTMPIDWELDSVLSYETRSDMEDSEPIDNLWGDSPTASLRFKSTKTQPLLDCSWVEPEYPEVWRMSP